MSDLEQDTPLIQTGNAKIDGAATRGWLVGNFLSENCGLRRTDDVEVKWGEHEAGTSREEWVTGETRTALCMLISGKFIVEFRNRTVTLDKPGDYVMWGPGVDHKWYVTESGTVITVRWPSIVTE